ncbi:Fis family transcriptional regulator, partial [Candidatus Magnetoovum chiemensis]
MKILVIDDEAQIRRFLRISFESQGYKVEEAADAAEGLKLAPLIQPNVIILDLGLPDMDGLNVLRNIRGWSSAPIIILSVKNDETTIVEALDLGADDYLTKPFGLGELLARIRAALRKNQPPPQSPVFELDRLRVDFNARIVTVNDIEIKLTSTEYELLAYFIKNAGKVLTYRQILKEIWGGNSVEQNQYL